MTTLFARHTFAILGLVGWALACHAQIASPTATPLQPGQFVREGSSGQLNLKQGPNGMLRFTIDAQGDNGHSCSLDGDVRNGKARLPGVDEKVPCIVTFRPTVDGIDVSGSSFEACGTQYCGMRATFEGVYFVPPPVCLSKALAATRKTFKQQYDARQYAEARGTLEPVLSVCKRTLHWLDEARIRNDVAVTLHKLKEFSACQAVLAPLAEDAKLSDAGVRENYAPLEADLYLPVVRATRTNLKLCKH